MSYEKRAIRELKNSNLGTVHYHKWIEFVDANGRGYCEPEAFIEYSDRIVLFECKLTGGPSGKIQMLDLYKPVLEHIFKKPVDCLMVCKWVRPDTPGPFVKSVEEFLLSKRSFATWQWLPY